MENILQLDRVPFYPGDLFFGEKTGVALCTLWTPKYMYQKMLKDFEIIGNLYSLYGVGIMIRNVLATPGIKNIIFTGIDHPEPKRRVLKKLLERDLDPEDICLDQEYIDLFYERTNLIDKTHIKPSVKYKLLEDLSIKPADNLEPVIIDLPKFEVTDSYPTADAGHIFRGNNISAIHYDINREIINFGHDTSKDKEGHYRKELWQVMSIIDKETSLESIPLYDEEEIERYGESLWNGDEVKTLTYRYGHTMRFKYGDQISEALNALRKKNETFRAVISLWEPYHSMIRDDEPCLITIHLRIFHNRLNVFAYIRTNEMFRGWPKNVGGLLYLQRRMAQELEIDPGDLTVVSGSAHVYDTDFVSIRNYLGDKRIKRKFISDPKGDWRIFKERESYVGEHYYQGNLLHKISAVDAEVFLKEIKFFITDIDHALYIGSKVKSLELGE